MEEKLLALVNRIEKLRDDGIKNSSLKPEEESFFRWKLKDFKYGIKGIESSSAEEEYFTKPSWFRAARQLEKLIKSTDEYISAVDVLKDNFKNRESLEQLIDSFVDQAIWRCLNAGNDLAFDKSGLVKRFISDLEGKPATYGAKIQFQGIVLEPIQIKIPEVGVMLRQPTRDDLEKERPYWAHPFSYPAHPSAIGELSFIGHHGRDIQFRVEKLTALLRLFRVGSVKHLSYSMYTDSLIDTTSRGTISSGGQLVAIESSYIKTGDEGKLKNFIQILDPLLPPKFYRFGEGEVSHVTIAFDRYNDALLRVGILEERIANAVMGLEALLLDATQELSYRLGLRIAKTFSLLGDDGKQIREILKDAYRVRNLFAHGSHLSVKERRRLETKHVDLNNLLKTILDYLRRFIVLTIVIQISKEEFIFLLDDALIDKEAEVHLSNRIAIVKDIW
ncbi:MAG TPA: hypothetical protein VNK70_01105 [Candidatus Paceibacterota bacterium]|nr:hypothetical protein [Candidatus Paceibacterota bacterium]